MKRNSNLIYAGAAGALLVAAGIGFGVVKMSKPSAPAAETEAAAPAQAGAPELVQITQQAITSSQIGVAKATAGELDAAISASATVEATPDAEAVLTSRAPGVVTRIFKRIGDPVSVGETLALVESQQASSIAADQAAASARVTLAQRQLARERSLLDQGVSPRADFETAEANLAVAQADARRASAAAGAARISRDGRSVSVVSPVAGRVTALTANLGQFVTAEAELFRVSDTRRLQITASIPPLEAGRVQAGDRVEMRVGDQTLEGRVRSAISVVDPNSRAATVVIDPIGNPAVLAPGQVVQARIFGSRGAVSDGVMVPQDAVQTVNGRSVVFVRAPNGFRAQPVQIGARNGGLVSITSGLPAGTEIATTNAFLVKAELEKESAE